MALGATTDEMLEVLREELDEANRREDRALAQLSQAQARIADLECQLAEERRDSERLRNLQKLIPLMLRVLPWGASDIHDKG